MLVSASLLLALPVLLQEPDAALQRGLDSRDPAARLTAAVEVADLGVEAEAWLVRETLRGSDQRRRALLLSAALLGTPDSFQALADAAKPGNRPDEVRAYALLLYGAFHPEAPQAAPGVYQKLRSAFERSCLMVGLLQQASRVESAQSWIERGRKAEAAHFALASMADALAGRDLPDAGDSAHEWSGRLLASVLPTGTPLDGVELAKRGEEVLPVWTLAARRRPARSQAELQREILSGSGGGVALALLESETESVGAEFKLLDARITDPSVKAWLWGAAGDRGYAPPIPEESALTPWEAAGLLRLGIRDPSAAKEAAAARRDQARRLFRGSGLDAGWPAALVLALAPAKEDVDDLRQRVSEATGKDAKRLHSIWQFARGSTTSEEARRHQLRSWSRELGASYQGYLDQEGPRWTAYLLVSGTRAALESATLAVELEDLGGERDHSLDSELYPDLLEYLLSPHYRWDLP